MSSTIISEAIQGRRYKAKVHEGHEIRQLALAPLREKVLVELEGLLL